MAASSHNNVLPLDVVTLVLRLLDDDKLSQSNVSLTCRAWHSLAQAALLRRVNISSHNLGRRPEFEHEWNPVAYADHHGAFRQHNLIPRQRAFLRLLSAHPELARHVKELAWTLVWLDYEEEDLTETDRLTWSVFKSLRNVTKLDLTSLHDVHTDNFVRQSPVRLFPAVTHLRLGGWMHRSLIKAIFTSINLSNLRSLKFDCLQDEGAFPDGAPMNDEFAIKNAHTHNASSTASSLIVDSSLLQRQERGEAIIYPGPMWLPMHLLVNGAPLSSLISLRIKVASFDGDVDLRNYHTLFASTAELLVKARSTLQYLTIAAGEQSGLDQPTMHGCATTRNRFRSFTRPWLIQMASRFMVAVLSALNRHEFPRLEKVQFEGFRLLKTIDMPEKAANDVMIALQAIEDCRVENSSFTDEPSAYHPVFLGYECFMDEMRDIERVLVIS